MTLLVCLFGVGLSIPVNAPLSPSEEAKIAEPGTTLISDVNPKSNVNQGTVDAAAAPLSGAKTAGDLDTANTLLFGLAGLGYPGLWGGYGFGYGYGYPYGSYGYPYRGWGGYGIYG